MAVITISDTGVVEFTRKPEMLALFDGERKDIVRMTDILHSPEHDLYYVKFLTGPFAGRAIDLGLLMEIGSEFAYAGLTLSENFPDKVFWMYNIAGDSGYTTGFATYEAAVRAEVIIVDDMRKLGMKLDA